MCGRGFMSIRRTNKRRCCHHLSPVTKALLLLRRPLSARECVICLASACSEGRRLTAHGDPTTSKGLVDPSKQPGNTLVEYYEAFVSTDGG